MTKLSSFGLDRTGVTLAIGFSVAALLALSIAMVIGLDNPYWAGVAVWVTAGQPSRELLLNRVVFRLLGTAIGSAVGLFIVYAAHQPIVVVGLLVVWLTFCTAVGNLFRQFRAYAWFLSGYTAAIVVLPSYFDTAHLHHFAEARVVCNFIGVFCVIAVVLALRPSLQDASVTQINQAAGRVLTWIAGVLRGDAAAVDPANARKLLIELARVEDTADTSVPPSLAGYRMVRQIRHLAIALVALVTAGRALHQQKGFTSDAVSEKAQTFADLIDERIAAEKDARNIDGRLRAFDAPPALAHVATAINNVTSDLQRLTATGEAEASDQLLVYHHDWHAIRIAALRTFVTVLAVGLVWVGTGWPNGALALIGASIFVLVFSNLDTPRQMVETAIKGSAVGLIAALLASAFVLPHVNGQWQMLLAVTPFIVAGSFGFAHPVTARPAIDANAVFLIALQLSWPPLGDVWHTLENGVTLLVGMSAAWLTYYLIPTKPARRVDALTMQIVRDLDRFRIPQAGASLQRLRMRLYHSVMRLALRLSGRPNDPLLDSALAALGVAETVSENGVRKGQVSAGAERAGGATPQAMLDEAVARLAAQAEQTRRD